MFNEMSGVAKPMSVNIQAETDYWEKYKSSFEFLDTVKVGITEFDFWFFHMHQYLQIYLLREGDPNYKITGDITDDSKGFAISSCIRLSQTGIYIEDVYAVILLNHFQYVQSDNLHTRRGYQIYKKLTMRDDVIVDVVDDTTDEIVVHNVAFDELDNYYGKGKEQYIFRVSKTKQ